MIGQLKLALAIEAEAWKTCLATTLSMVFKGKLMRITEFLNDQNKVLARKITDLEDVRVAMKCLANLREDFIYLDMELILIEETYSVMGKFNIHVSKEEQDTVDGLRYNFTNVLLTVNG